MEYKDSEGNTALDYAVSYDVDNADKKAFDILMDFGAMPSENTLNRIMNKIDIDRYGMLHRTLSVKEFDIDKTVKAVFRGEDVTEEIEEQWLIEGIAAFGTWENLERHIENADIAQLLKAAVIYNNKDTAANLIAKYPDISLAEPRNDYLYYASCTGDVELVNLVYTNMGGNMAFAAETAISKKNNDILTYFLDMGLDVNCNALMGTLVGCGSFYNNYEAVKILLERGAYPDDDALTKACIYGHTDIARLLIQYGADADYKNYYEDGSGGDSALMQAISRGQFECVKLLVENGADVHYKYVKYDAKDMAKASGSENVYNYICIVY